jgi:hypothetical protein
VPQRLEIGGITDTTLPSWSPQKTDESIYYVAHVSGKAQIFKSLAQGGKALVLTPDGGDWPLVSPDGARIYYINDGASWSVPVGGGPPTRVAGLPQLPEAFWGARAVGGAGIYFINPSPPAGIDYLPFATERIARVLDLPGKPAPWARLTLSPDESRLLYAQIDAITSDIMLVDNFR